LVCHTKGQLLPAPKTWGTPFISLRFRILRRPATALQFNEGNAQKYAMQMRPLRDGLKIKQGEEFNLKREHRIRRRQDVPDLSACLETLFQGTE